MFGCSHTSITRKAKKKGWVQDKTAVVQQKTKAALLHQNDCTNDCTKTPTLEDIEVAVRTNVEVIRGHRKDIKKGREIYQKLSEQLDGSINPAEGIESKNVACLRDLSTALKTLIALERQAFNIDAEDQTAKMVLVELD